MIVVQAAYAKNGESRSVPVNGVSTETLREVRLNNHQLKLMDPGRKRAVSRPSGQNGSYRPDKPLFDERANSSVRVCGVKSSRKRRP
jgi:hypothetical protein